MMLPPTSTDSSGVALLPSAFWAVNAATEHPEASAMLVDWFLHRVYDELNGPLSDAIAAIPPS